MKNSKFNYIALFLLAVVLFFSLQPRLSAQYSLAQVGSQAPESAKVANAGQHSPVQQVAPLAEVGTESGAVKWSFSLRPRSSRIHPGSELDSIKQLKTSLKLASLIENPGTAVKKQTASTPIIGTNFEGNWSVTSHPPDNSIAISNGGFIVSVNNDGIEYYNESGSLLFVEDWSNFINDNSLTSTIYDPVVFYDSQADRFVLAVLHGTTPTTSKILLLFSKGNDPNNGWHVYTLSGNPLNDGSWFDYPKLGVSDQEVFVTGNLYDANENFNQSIIYQVEKSQGFNGGNLNYQYWFNLSSQPFPAFTLVPASYGHQGNVGPGMLFVSTRPGGENRVRLWQITNYLNNSPTLNTFTANVTSYSPAGDGLMPNTNLTLNNSDCRILNAFFLNNVVHYVFHSDINQGWNGIHYNRLNTNNVSNQTAVLGKAGSEDYSFPVIASFASQTTDPSVMVSFLHTSQSIYPSTSVVYCNSAMQWSQPALIKAGTNYVSFLQGNRQRWGDYNGMSRKHNSSTPVVWSATSFGTDIVTSSGSLPNTYKTWIAKIQGAVVSEAEYDLSSRTMSVYPNPLEDLLQIEFDLENREEIVIEILDLSGKRVKLLYHDTPKSSENRLSFNRGALAPGSYLLSISNHQKTLHSEKIIAY